MRNSIPRAAMALAVLSAAQAALANSGVQLPLSSYSAGSETTDSSLVTNPGFETVDGNNVPTGWTPNLPVAQNIMRATAPDAANLPNPPAVLQTKSAQAFRAGGIDPFQDYKISQTVTLAPNTDYVISGYLWNFALPGNAPHNDFFAGDLAVLEVVDPNDSLINAGVILEPIALDNATGSRGYFCYKTFNSSQFTTGQVSLEVEFDPNQDRFFGQNRPDLSAQWDNVGITPLNTFSAQVWNNPAGGTWLTAGNWVNGPANARGAVASFKVASAGAANIDLGGDVNLNTINFDAEGGYVIGGAAGTMFLDHEERNEHVILNNFKASNSITRPIVVGVGTANLGGVVLIPRTLRANVANAAGVLTVSGGISAASVGTLGTGTFDVVKNGPGRLDTYDFDARQLIINQGEVQLVANSTAAQRVKVGTLTIAGGTTPTAKLDLSNSALVVDYTDVSPIAGIKTQILAGLAGGSWSGNGIVTQRGVGYGVGYAEASDLAAVPAVFGVVDATSVLLRGTLYGDSNLDGAVSITDFSLLASNFNTPGEWVDGNFDYDTDVDISDFSLLAANFNRTASDLPRAAVPEPCTGVVAAGLLVLRRRRG